MASFKRPAGASAALAMVAAQLAPLPLPLLSMAPAAAQYGARSVNVNCVSSSNRPNRCRLPENTQSLTFMGPDRSGRCQEGRTWWRNGNELTVSGGCGGVFEARVVDNNWGGNNGGNWGGNNGGNWGGNNGGNWGNRPGNGNNWGRGFAGEIDCGSWNNNNRQRCNARTENRVELVQVQQGNCVQGRDWSFTNSRIEVRNGCRARFAYGYGNLNPGYNNGGGYYPGNQRPDNGGGGPSAGAVIGGVALAAGLVALLAAAGKKNNNNSSATGNARISADLSKFPSDARTEAQACLDEAGRQIGSTGGSHVSLTRVDRADRSSAGWALVGQLSGTYDGKAHNMTMDCRANGSKVTAFEVR